MSVFVVKCVSECISVCWNQCSEKNWTHKTDDIQLFCRVFKHINEQQRQHTETSKNVCVCVCVLITGKSLNCPCLHYRLWDKAAAFDEENLLASFMLQRWVEWAGHFLSACYQLRGVNCHRDAQKDGKTSIQHPNTLDMAGAIFRRNIRQRMDDRSINDRTAGATVIQSSVLRRWRSPLWRLGGDVMEINDTGLILMSQDGLLLWYKNRCVFIRWMTFLWQ